MARLSFRLSLLAFAALAPAAIAMAREDVVPEKAGANWRAVATADDRNRIRHWRDAWVAALAQANRSNAAAITAGLAILGPKITASLTYISGLIKSS